MKKVLTNPFVVAVFVTLLGVGIINSIIEIMSK